LALSNEEMYKLAQQTASYKERKISHEASLAEIAGLIGPLTFTLDLVRREKNRNPKLKRLYDWSMTTRRKVRRNKLNSLIPAQ